jgi:putative intracellular protease/amidase
MTRFRYRSYRIPSILPAKRHVGAPGGHVMTKSILMIASNPATSPVTGWPIGFWWAELTHAYEAFRAAGHEVTLASPGGGDLTGDALSDPEDESGYSVDDTISLRFKKDPERMALLTGTPALSDLDATRFDAVFVVGGQGPMVTMIDDAKLHRLFADTYESGRVAAAVCHGTAILLKARGSDGELLVKGKRWTGFADAEERIAEEAVGQTIQPFWIETEAKKLDGTEFVTAPEPFSVFAVRDGNLVTGQQQMSSGAAAAEVIAALDGR